MSDDKITICAVGDIMLGDSAACGRVLDDPSLAAKLGGGARQRIVDEFSIDTLCRRVTEIYLTLAGRT